MSADIQRGRLGERPATHLIIDDVAPLGIDIAALSTSIRNSRLLGESQLVGPFEATRGFGIACHLSAVEEALARVPWLRPFVALAVDDQHRRALFSPSFLESFATAVFGDLNALYVNVLAVPPGGAVPRHIDSTLGTAADDPRVITPRAVAVLYVDVPDDLVGGQLRLFAGDEVVATIEPRRGRFVLFRGNLGHEVAAVTSSSPRISVVAELYTLPRVRLVRLPRVRLQSQGFKAVLERLR
jgi:hypothetical protein